MVRRAVDHTAFVLAKLVLAGILQQLERGAFQSMAKVRGIAQSGQLQVAWADQSPC